jgi:hypothetical protein
MKKSPSKRKRPAVLVRFYPEDIAIVNAACQEAGVPRENFIRRAVLSTIVREDARRMLESSGALIAKKQRRVAKKTAPD